jgi:hypothetical protein
MAALVAAFYSGNEPQLMAGTVAGHDGRALLSSLSENALTFKRARQEADDQTACPVCHHSHGGRCQPPRDHFPGYPPACTDPGQQQIGGTFNDLAKIPADALEILNQR